MPRFLALYTMPAEALAAFYARPKAEQTAIDDAGLPAWEAWEAAHAAAILDPGGMVGRTTRIDAAGVHPATNDICGWLVVEAADVEAAARLFEGHPHFTVFPGDGVDLMPIVTGS